MTESMTLCQPLLGWLSFNKHSRLIIERPMPPPLCLVPIQSYFLLLVFRFSQGFYIFNKYISSAINTQSIYSPTVSNYASQTPILNNFKPFKRSALIPSHFLLMAVINKHHRGLYPSLSASSNDIYRIPVFTPDLGYTHRAPHHCC